MSARWRDDPDEPTQGTQPRRQPETAQAVWHIEGDFGWHYPEDDADLTASWLPRLNGA